MRIRQSVRRDVSKASVTLKHVRQFNQHTVKGNYHLIHVF